MRNIQDESKTDFKGRDDSPSRERVQPTTVGKAKTNIRKKAPVGGNKNKKKSMNENDVAAIAQLFGKPKEEISTAITNGGVSKLVADFTASRKNYDPGGFR